MPEELHRSGTPRQQAHQILDELLTAINRLESTYRAGDPAKALVQELRRLLNAETEGRRLLP